MLGRETLQVYSCRDSLGQRWGTARLPPTSLSRWLLEVLCSSQQPVPSARCWMVTSLNPCTGSSYRCNGTSLLSSSPLLLVTLQLQATLNHCLHLTSLTCQWLPRLLLPHCQHPPLLPSPSRAQAPLGCGLLRVARGSSSFGL